MLKVDKIIEHTIEDAIEKEDKRELLIDESTAVEVVIVEEEKELADVCPKCGRKPQKC